MLEHMQNQLQDMSCKHLLICLSGQVAIDHRHQVWQCVLQTAGLQRCVGQY
jgi:hypothetical protein